MEENPSETAVAWLETSDDEDATGWVSPDVAFARAGAQVQMGKDLSTNQDTDPNA